MGAGESKVQGFLQLYKELEASPGVDLRPCIKPQTNKQKTLIRGQRDDTADKGTYCLPRQPELYP